MKNFIKTSICCIAVCLTFKANAQLINCNPDPNGEPWWAGGLPEVTSEIQAELDVIPPLEISSKSSATVLPPYVDNSKKIWFRPIFLQKDGCCGQASGVGYTFTYEVNRIRDLNANVPQNQYPTHFTWNFLNKQDRWGGSWYYQGWDIIKQMGVPTVEDYGGMYKPNLSDTARADIWETGYEKYREALNNKVLTEYHYIDVSSPAGLEELKHWLNDHGSGDDSGGLANFAAKIYNTEYGELPDESDEAGKNIVIRWGNDGLHAMTIVGYNDNIKFDFDGDQNYSNPSNNMAKWEIGALKVANSWDTSYCDSGFVYMPYRLLAMPYDSGGIYTNNIDTQKYVHVLSATSSYNPEMTLKVSVQHPCRKQLKFYSGYSNNANQAGPNGTYGFAAFNYDAWYDAACLPMQGINEDPIELCLDYGQFYNLDNVGKVYFIVHQDSGQHNGTISDFSLIDYRWNEIFELPYSGIPNVSIVNNGYTMLGIPYHLLPFEQSIIANLTLDTDRVARRTVTVSNHSTLTINEGVHLDMYGTEAYYCKLLITPNSTLVIGDNAIITAKRGNCEIEVNGNIQIGQNVTFKAENGATLKIRINGQQIVVIDGCTFTNATLQATIGSNGAPSFTNTSSFSISNCTFSALGNQCEYALRVDGYSSIMLADNTVNGVGLMSSRFYTDGILLYNCGASGIGSQILRNTIKGCTDTGLTLYGTTADIKGKNEITQCFTGVKLFNGSTVNNFMGNCGASNASQTQYIHDNDNSEVYIYRDCMPQTFRFNCITNSGNGWFVEYEDNVDNGKGLCTRLDLEYNTWGNYTNTQIGNHFHYITNTNNGVVFDFLPKWSYGECLSSYEEEAQRKSVEADSLWNIGLYTSAKVSYKEIVTLYPNTSSALNAMKKLLLMEGNDGENYAGLQYYYLNDTTIQGNESLSALAGSLANKCDEFMEHYEQAIAWYEAIIENEETPYIDSIFATIDLGNLYLKMEGNGTKDAKGRLTQFVPKSAEAFAKQTDEALRKLKIVSWQISPTRELPEHYWTDLVTEQPEDYVVDCNGDVHLYSAEALAWLISVVNGLNGQEADNYEGRIVCLESDIDLSPAIWTAIASANDSFFKGIFNGNNHIINGMSTNEGFFGNLNDAKIKNVILKNTFVKDSRQGIFFHQSEFCEIDRCWLEGEIFVSNTSELACFGYEGTASQITNCMFRSPLIDNPSGTNPSQPICAFIENSNGNNTIRNCAIVIDSLAYPMDACIVGINSSGNVSNCYSYLGAYKYFELWPYLYNQRSGIVGINYGSIANCYYNWLNPNLYHDLVNTPAVFAGEMNDVLLYNYDESDWQLMGSVNIGGYESSNLLEALNRWGEQQSNTGNYSRWCIDESILPNGLPVLSCFADLLSVKENKMSSSFISVYPNPANAIVSVEGMDCSNIKMYNALGQMVRSSEVNIISVSGLPEGLYFLHIDDGNGNVITKKVIVK